jgi:hypothetical protein
VKTSTTTTVEKLAKTRRLSNWSTTKQQQMIEAVLKKQQPPSTIDRLPFFCLFKIIAVKSSSSRWKTSTGSSHCSLALSCEPTTRATQAKRHLRVCEAK